MLVPAKSEFKSSGATCLKTQDSHNFQSCFFMIYSPKWLIYDVYDIPIVITRANGTLSLKSKLNPEQSLVHPVNRQCLQLLCCLNQCGCLLPSYITPLDTWTHPTRQPKQKPAKVVIFGLREGGFENEVFISKMYISILEIQNKTKDQERR